jgi:NAD(P)-dependent dehydrogenase (short-subunit alcohol dehydrogenase family)
MSQLRFDGRVAIVTGAGRGLGREYAKLLAARGASVVVNDNGGELDGTGFSAEPAKSVVEEITAAKGIAVADTSSVASAEGGEALVAHALEAFGRVDIVINNAGVLRDKAFHNMTHEMWDTVHATHLRGAFNVTRPAFAKMRAQGHGRIVMTSSPSGTYGNFGQANYSSAKMGLVGFARTLSIEGAKFDIRANVVSPNAATRMTAGLTGDLGPHMGPEKVAPLVAYLCHESCALAGEVMTAGAGRYARVFVGETAGFFNPTATIEDVAAYAARLAEDTQFTTPRGVPDASALIAKAIQGGTRA